MTAVCSQHPLWADPGPTAYPQWGVQSSVPQHPRLATQSDASSNRRGGFHRQNQVITSWQKAGTLSWVIRWPSGIPGAPHSEEGRRGGERRGRGKGQQCWLHPASGRTARLGGGDPMHEVTQGARTSHLPDSRGPSPPAQPHTPPPCMPILGMGMCSPPRSTEDSNQRNKPQRRTGGGGRAARECHLQAHGVPPEGHMGPCLCCGTLSYP